MHQNINVSFPSLQKQHLFFINSTKPGLAMKTFLKRGVLTVLPTALSIWIIYALVIALDDLGSQLISSAGMEEPVKGAGFVLILVFLMVVGAILSFRISRWLYSLFEKFLMNFPVLNTIYSAIKDIANLIGNEEKLAHRTVLVKQGNGTLMLGFVTSDTLPQPIRDALPEQEKWVTVLYPLSYQVAGVPNLVKESELIDVDWDFEGAMRFMLTAGVAQERQG